MRMLRGAGLVGAVSNRAYRRWALVLRFVCRFPSFHPEGEGLSLANVRTRVNLAGDRPPPYVREAGLVGAVSNRAYRRRALVLRSRGRFPSFHP